MPMEVPSEVLVHSELLGLKGTRGRLLQISPNGYFEINLKFGDKTHRVLLPVERTVVIAEEPEEVAAKASDVER